MIKRWSKSQRRHTLKYRGVHHKGVKNNLPLLTFFEILQNCGDRYKITLGKVPVRGVLVN